MTRPTPPFRRIDPALAISFGILLFAALGIETAAAQGPAAASAPVLFSDPALYPLTLLKSPGVQYMDFSVRSNRLAVAEVFPGGGGVEVFDISDPTAPESVAQIRLPYPVWDVALFRQGGTNFVVFGTEAVPVPSLGLQIYALTAAGPMFVSHPSHIGLAENVHHVLVEQRGGQRYLYAGATTGMFAAVQAHLDIYDITQPASPQLLTTLYGYVSGGVPHVIFTHDFQVSFNPLLGRRVLYVGAVADGVVLFDVEDPANPAFLAQSVNWGPGVDGHQVVPSADGRYLFVTNEWFGPPWGALNVLDISGAVGPSGIFEVDRYEPGSSFVHYARLLGDFVFASCAVEGLRVFHVTDSGRLEEVGSSQTNLGSGVEFCWDVLPVVTPSRTIAIVDDIGEGLWILGFEPFRAELGGPTQVPSLRELDLRVVNSTSLSGRVRGRLLLQGGGTKLTVTREVPLHSYSVVPFEIPPDVGPVPPGPYSFTFEVLQFEAGVLTYRHRVAGSIEIG